MNKNIFILCLMVPFIFCFEGCVTVKKESKKNMIIGTTAGANIPNIGMAIDVSYDQGFDNVVPGYKIVTVAITNSSIDILRLDPKYDDWQLIDVKGSKHQGIVDLRSDSPKTYILLQSKLRKLIEYPLMVQVGETGTIDLLFRDSVKLDGFRSVRFKSAGLGKIIEIESRD